MRTIALFGAGKIGEAITALLTLSGRYQVRLCDRDLTRATHLALRWRHTEAHELRLDDTAHMQRLLEGCDAVISALPYYCNVPVAQQAREAGVHYFDLTEDVETTKAIERIAAGTDVRFMPQCGLAPGFVSIAAAHLMALFDTVSSTKLRVGALPVYPSNRLKYNLTWSTEGLINEYGNMCEVVEDGRKQLAFPLEGYERFSLDGVEYEAFNTSGGLGSLCDTFEGKIRSLDYKSVRYPGHRELVAFLMNDLRFNEDRETLRAVMERSISATDQDKCLIFVEVQGHTEGRFLQRTYASTVYNAVLDRHHFGAIQLTTASGVCAPLDLFLEGRFSSPRHGIMRNEDIPLGEFLGNEFGRWYRDERALGAAMW
jgi:saccharopine dehydrogenase-like NADP-dependent oxidoreductase